MRTYLKITIIILTTDIHVVLVKILAFESHIWVQTPFKVSEKLALSRPVIVFMQTADFCATLGAEKIHFLSHTTISGNTLTSIWAQT